MDLSKMDRLDRETISSAVTIKTDTGSKVLPGDKRGLPYEIWAIILSYLSAEDLCSNWSKMTQVSDSGPSWPSCLKDLSRTTRKPAKSTMVCKTWHEVVLSLDSTKWRDLYLKSTSWRHPYWPLNLSSNPHSWRQAYKEQYISSIFWTQIDKTPASVTCMSVFKRTKLRKTITVGVGKEYETLKGALAVANDFDRIEVYPGIYDEQFEMSSKIPFELVGCGELGSVILVVCIEQTAITGRISNLVFRAPWFTNFILKVRSGYLQVDNCIMEDGMVYVQNPGSVAMSFCTFRHATVILQHVNASIIQNCEFSQTDSAAITVEGYPKEDKNWTFQKLNNKIMSTSTFQKKPDRRKSADLLIPKSAYSLSTATIHKKYGPKFSGIHRQMSGDTDANRRRLSQDIGSQYIEGHSCNMSVQSRGTALEGAVGGAAFQPLPRQHVSQSASGSHNSNITQSSRDIRSISDHEGDIDDIIQPGIKAHAQNSTVSTKNALSPPKNSLNDDKNTNFLEHHTEKFKRIENFVSDCAKYSNPGTSGESTIGDDEHDLSRSQVGERSNFAEDDIILKQFLGSNQQNDTENPDSDSDSDKDDENTGVKVPALDLHSLASRNTTDPDRHGDGAQDLGAHRERSLSSSEVSLHTASSNDVSEEEDGGSYNSSDGASTTSSSEDESLPVSDNDSEFSSSEESVIMLTYPERHQPRSLSAQKECADIASINSQNQSEHIDIIQDSDMKQVLNEVRGCFIHKCRITQSKGAVMVSLQAHAIIMECEINSVGYGIRCIQNSRTVILKNEIHHCRTSGVFMRLAASGLVTGNDIHSNCEAGVDIRKNADPIVQCNRIHHGKRSGVVVLGSGRGQIKHNDIYQNKEAGIYILYRGNPTVSNNQIYSGRAAGIAVNESGRGYIHSNVITGNQWGGIDIRHGGEPVIHQNTVCNGISDGIVIGEGGKGTIQHNIITGNAGCGVWVMAAHQPLIHGNEIHSNRDTGICLVNRMDSSHKNETLMVESKDTPSQRSLDFLRVGTEDQISPQQRTVTMATIEHNKVFHNEGKGISVQFGDAVMIENNLIQDNKSDGLTVDQPFPATVKNNSLTCNSGSGIVVSGQGKVDIYGNGIFDNKDHGIWSQSEADIIENDIIGNNRSAVHLIKCSKASIRRNRIYSSKDYALCLADIKHCEVEDNIFYGQGDKIIRVDDKSHCSKISNQILHPPACQSTQPVRKDQEDMSPLGTTRWQLVDPAPRPHMTTPLQVSYTPSQHVTTITRVTVPADNCERGSRFCVIV